MARVPGVNIQEVRRGPTPIQRASTGVAGIVGPTQWGPPNRPQLVTSWQAYQRRFGGWLPESYIPDAAFQFFNQGGAQLWVCRITGPDATVGSVTLSDRAATPAPTLRIDALYPTRAAMAITIEDARYEPSSRFRLLVAFEGQVVEAWEELSMDPADTRYVVRVLEGSEYVRAVDLDSPTTPPGDRPATGTFALVGGDPDHDGITDTEVVGAVDAAGRRTGLAALEIEPINYVAAPGCYSDVIHAALIAHAQSRRRYALLDVPPDTIVSEAVAIRRQYDSSYAGLLYNWASHFYPPTGSARFIPPSAWWLGVRARVDAQRGPWKSAANEPIPGALAVERRLADGDIETLTDNQIVPLHLLDQGGIRIWGTRTLSTDGEWLHDTRRLLFLFAENSIAAGIRWAAFEPNNRSLWERLRASIRQFIEGELVTPGALKGGEGVGYMVIVDETNNPPTTPKGHVYVDVGLADAEPAEFIWLRFGAMESGTSVSEG